MYPIGNTVSDPTLLALLNSKWTSNFLQLDITASGRTGQGLTVQFGSFIFKTLAHQSHWSGTLAFKVNTGNAGGGPLYLIQNNGTRLFYIQYNFDNTLSLFAGGNVIATCDKAVSQDAWYEIGWDVDLAGLPLVTASLWVNGEKWINAASGNSGVFPSGLLSQSATGNVHVLESGLGTAGNTTFDDLVICDPTGSFNTGGFFGDAQIVCIYPDADIGGPEHQWDASTGTVHFSLINEHVPDGDATYIQAAASGKRDIWAWQSIGAFSGAIKGCQYGLYARKTAEGSKSFAQYVCDITGTGNEQIGAERFLSDDYIYYLMCLDADPATGMPFSPAGFDATTFGVQVVS